MAIPTLNSVLVAVSVVLDNLNPVSIGVQQESNVVHAAICQSLLPVALEILKSLASSIQVIYGNA